MPTVRPDGVGLLFLSLAKAVVPSLPWPSSSLPPETFFTQQPTAQTRSNPPDSPLVRDAFRGELVTRYLLEFVAVAPLVPSPCALAFQRKDRRSRMKYPWKPDEIGIPSFRLTSPSVSSLGLLPLARLGFPLPPHTATLCLVNPPAKALSPTRDILVVNCRDNRPAKRPEQRTKECRLKRRGLTRINANWAVVLRLSSTAVASLMVAVLDFRALHSPCFISRSPVRESFLCGDIDWHFFPIQELSRLFKSDPTRLRKARRGKARRNATVRCAMRCNSADVTKRILPSLPAESIRRLRQSRSSSPPGAACRVSRINRNTIDPWEDFTISRANSLAWEN